MNYFEKYMLDLQEMRAQAEKKRDNKQITDADLKEYDNRFSLCEKMVRIVAVCVSYHLFA